MKARMFFLSAALVTVLAGCQGQKNPSVSSEEDKTLYSVGSMFGSRLKELSLNEKELDIMVKGLRDSAMGKKLEVEPEAYQQQVQQLFRQRIMAASEANKKKGTEYLENFVKNEGGTKTDSGLAYKIIEPGTGEAPAAEDTVEVHYHGTLTDGTVFDSSKDRGQTVSFPLNRVIKGWTEGLQLVKPGGKIKLVIPSELAYGEHGAPPKIPGSSTLVFDVELVKVTKADEKKAPAPAAKGKGKKK